MKQETKNIKYLCKKHFETISIILDILDDNKGVSEHVGIEISNTLDNKLQKELRDKYKLDIEIDSSGFYEFNFFWDSSGFYEFNFFWDSILEYINNK